MIMSSYLLCFDSINPTISVTHTVGEMKIVEMHIVQERSVGCYQSVAKMHNHGIQGKLISV